MGDTLQGVAFSQADFLSLLDNIIDSKNVEKTVSVKTKGFKEGTKEISGFTSAAEKLNSLKTDEFKNQIAEIRKLLTGSFKNINVNQVLSDLLDPGKSAEDLSKTIHQLYSDLMTLKNVTGSQNITGFTDADIKRIIKQQNTIDSLIEERDQAILERKAEAKSLSKPVDILSAAKQRKIQREPYSTIAERLSIDKSQANVKNGDDTLLQNYQRTADVLSKMVSERKAFNKLTKNNAGDYVKQEQDILSVFNQLQDIEKKVVDRFHLDPDRLLSNQFKNKNGQFDFKGNVDKAVNAYVKQMTSTFETAIKRAQDSLDTSLSNAAQRSAERVERKNENLGVYRAKIQGGNVGTEISESVAEGMGKAENATNGATDGIQKYALSAEQTISKLKELRLELEELDKTYVDSDFEDTNAEKGIKEKSAEAYKYIANLQGRGYSDEKISDLFGEINGTNAYKYIQTYSPKSEIGDVLTQIKTYAEQNPIEVPIRVGTDNSTGDAIEEVSEKAKILTDEVQSRQKITIFDGIQEQVFDTEKDFDALIAKLDEMAQRMKTPVFHAGKLDKETLLDPNYKPADNLRFVAEKRMFNSGGTGTYFASQLPDLLEVFNSESSRGEKQLYAADLSNYQNLLTFESDESQENFSSILKKITLFVLNASASVENFGGELKNMSFDKGLEGINTVDDLFKAYTDFFSKFGITSEKFQSFIQEEISRVSGYKTLEELNYVDSISTQFQKQLLKTNGFDITHGQSNDSYAFGSLIFDINKDHPFDIAFGNNTDIAKYFYQKVLEGILVKKALNPENYIDELIDDYVLPGMDKTAITSTLSNVAKNATPLSFDELNKGLIQKSAGQAGESLDVEQSKENVEQLKDTIASLREELQRFKDTGVEPEGIADLQTKLEDAEIRARSLSDELSILHENSVDISTYTQLEEELRDAQADAETLKEELTQVRTELEQSKTQQPLDSDALDKKVTELQYLHDKVRTIFDGPDGIVNEDMTYFEKFNSSEVQRMIELLNQLSDAELRAAGVMPDDENSYNTFRYNLQAEADAIKETQEMLQQAYDTGNYNGLDAGEIDVSIWDRLEHIYEIAQQVTNQFDSKLTPAVREFLQLAQGDISGGLKDVLEIQGIDKFVNSIIDGSRTAKEAFSDFENAFGYDTARFDSLIPVEVPQELKGLYDQLFSDVENRIKSAEQAAEEFNAKLKEIQVVNDNEMGSTTKFYRGVDLRGRGTLGEQGIYGQGSVSETPWFSSSLDVAKEYAGVLGEIYSLELDTNKIMTVDAQGEKWTHVLYLGQGEEEESKKLLSLYENLSQARKKLQEDFGWDGQDTSLLNIMKSSTEAQRAVMEYQKIQMDFKNSIGASDKYGYTSTDDLAKMAKEMGYQAIVIKNVMDSESGIIADNMSLLTGSMQGVRNASVQDLKGNIVETYNQEAEAARASADAQRQQEEAAESAATAEEHLKDVTTKAAQAGANTGEATQQHQEQAQSAEAAASAEEHLRDATQDSSGASTGAESAADALRQQEEAANAAANAAQTSSQADQQATEAAQARTDANNALAESEQAVAQAESAQTGAAAEGVVTAGQLAQGQNGNAESSTFAALSSQIAEINTQLTQKNKLIGEEIQLVENGVLGEVETFQAIEFAIAAIIEQLNQLVALLPNIGFDNFGGQDSLTRIETLLNDLNSLNQLLSNIDNQNIFQHLNNILESPSQEIGKNIQTITEKFKELRDVMNGFSDNGSAVFKSLSDIANAGDAMVDKMKKLFSESGVKTPKPSKQIDTTAASNILANSRTDILEAVNKSIAGQPGDLSVISTKMQAGADGIVKVVAIVKKALDDGSVAFQEYSYKAQDAGSGLTLLLESTKEGGTSLERQAQAYMKFQEEMSHIDPNKGPLGDILTGQVFTKESQGWEELIDLARQFGMELDDIDKITRKVKEGAESFTFVTKGGVSKTLGFDSNRVLMQTDPVFDRKAEEAAQKKAEERRARLAAERARQQKEEQDAIQKEYNTNLAAMDKLGKANSDKLFAEADQVKGKQNAEQMKQALNDVTVAADEAFEALQKIQVMWDSGLITDDQFFEAYQKYISDDIQVGSAKAQDALTAAKYNKIQQAVDNLVKSYERLADAENKAVSGSTAAVREKGTTTANAIRLYQEDLKTQIKGQTTSEQDAKIKDAESYYGRLQSAYASQKDIDTKNLGFGPNDDVEKTWDTLIAKAQQYINIVTKRDSHKTLTVNETKFLSDLGNYYQEAGEKAEQAGEKGKKFTEAMEAARSNVRSTSIDRYSNIIGNLEIDRENMPEAYNNQVIELQANLERLRNTDFGSPEWFTTIEALDNGVNKLNTDLSMRPIDETAKASLNRRMSDWLSKNTNSGAYGDQVRILQDQLNNLADSEADQNRIAQGFERITAAATEAGKVGRSFADGLIRRFKSLGQYLLSFASFYRIIGILKQAVNIVKELDSGLMEVRKVAQESTSTLKEWQKTTFNQADIVGGNATQIEKSTAAWLRLGKSFEESQEAAQASVKLLNVSEFENIDDATTSLVSMRQAFDDLTYEDFIDKLNGVGDNFSSSTDQLAQGMQNVSAVLKVQGNDIDQSLALLTAANSLAEFYGNIIQRTYLIALIA